MNLLLTSLACVTSQDPQAVPDVPAPAAPAVEAFTSLDEAALQARMKALLTPEEELAHAPVAGAVGSSPDCGVATVYRGPRREVGLVLACGDQVVRSDALQMWAGDEASATLLADANGDGKPEIVVLASWMSGMGPEGAVPFQANSVMTWDGQRLTHLEAAEKRVGELTRPEEVREVLGITQ